MAKTEVFIKRHILFLNGGRNLCVSTESAPKGINISGFTRYRRFLLARLYFKFIAGYLPQDLAINRAILQCGFSQKINLLGIKYFLFEFGTLAVDHYEIALYSNVPYAIYFRGYDASSMLSSVYYRERLKVLVEKSVCIFSVSNHLFENLSQSGINKKQSYVIPSSVEIASFIPRNDKNPYLFVSIGRMVEKKRHHDTLSAFARFIEISRDKRVKLVIIGDGPLYASIKSIAISLGMQDYVYMPGALPNSRVLAYLEQASYYIQSSATATNGDTEGFPSAIQEAMMRSCVIIASRHGGVPYYLKHKVDGLLSDEFFPEEMAVNLFNAYTDLEMSARLASNAYLNAVNNMDIIKNCARIDKLISSSASL